MVRAVVLRSKTVTHSTLSRRRCSPHGSSGARDRFNSDPRVSNRSTSPRARRLSTRISRRSSQRNHRLAMNVPVGSKWRRWTPFKRPFAHEMSPTHSRHALHDPPTSDISQHRMRPPTGDIDETLANCAWRVSARATFTSERRFLTPPTSPKSLRPANARHRTERRQLVHSSHSQRDTKRSRRNRWTPSARFARTETPMP